ncbi:MAG: TonB-dependent receptor [Candidatus Saccharicenans sp.]|nr:TonB-dependent receptor [Candidatus Saccharicenans sp.]
MKKLLPETSTETIISIPFLTDPTRFPVRLFCALLLISWITSAPVFSDPAFSEARESHPDYFFSENLNQSFPSEESFISSSSPSQQTEQAERKKKTETAEENQTSDEKQSEEQEKKTPKLFQLEPVYIEVVDRVRQNERPNMTVIQTDLFPLTISRTLDTALERQPGVGIQRIQMIGAALDDESVKIRGLGARRLLLLRDGRLLNSSGVAGGYFIDWTTIPLSSVSRIEVVKGVADARYGNTLGGVINLVPRQPQAQPAFEFESGYSSFATSAFSLFHSWKSGRLDYSLAASLQDSEGYLRNGSFNLKTGEFRLGYDLPFDGRLSAEVVYARVKKGFIVFNRTDRNPDSPDYETPLDTAYPASDGEYMYGGMGAYPEPGAWWLKERLLFSVNYDQSLGWAGLVRMNAWFNHGDREAYNTRTALDRVFHKKFYDDRSCGGSLEYRAPLSGSNETDDILRVPATLLAGIDFAHLRDDGDRNLPDDFRPPFRNGYYVASKLVNAYLQADLPLFSGNLTLTPGLRFMSYRGISGPSGIIEGIPDISMSGLSPSLKLTFADSTSSLFYLSLARALRFPTPPEHYWHYDADDSGVDTSNLPFKPEDGLMVQGGWKYELGARTRLEVAAFHYRIKNFIQFDLINFVSHNIELARLAGAEVEIARQLSQNFSTFANLTLFASRTSGDQLIEFFVRPEDRDFNRLPGVPAWKGNLGLRWKNSQGARIAAFVQAAGSQKVIYNRNLLWSDELQVVEQKGYARFDLEASYPLPRFKAVLSGFIHNIFNARYQERFGFPAAARSGGLNLKFSL